MREDIKKQWVEALRSGDYEQTTGQLIRREFASDTLEFCCLGVLCELLPQVERGESFYVLRAGLEEGYHATTGLPRGSAKDLGVDGLHETLYVEDADVQMTKQDILIGMNDGGDDFLTIADWIEENL